MEMIKRKRQKVAYDNASGRYVDLLFLPMEAQDKALIS